MGVGLVVQASLMLDLFAEKRGDAYLTAVRELSTVSAPAAGGAPVQVAGGRAEPSPSPCATLSPGTPLSPPRAPVSGPRILLVDDDPGVLKGLRGLLSDEGFSPVEARSAAEALRLLDAPGQPPALMVLGLRMPGETGLELLARLPKPLPVPVVGAPVGGVARGRAGVAPPPEARLLFVRPF